RTLEKEREKRYQSAAEMQAGVEGASRAAVTSPPHSRSGSRRPFSPPSSSQAGATRIIVIVLAVLSGLMLFAIAFSLVLALCGLSVVAFSSPEGRTFAGVMLLLFLIPLVVISWHRLWQARKGLAVISPGIRILTIWLPALALAFGCAWFQHDHALIVFQGRGDYLLNTLAVFAASLAIGLPLFWLICPRWTRRSRVRAGRMVAAAAVVLGGASLLAAKRCDGHWPFANYYGEIQLAGELRQPQEWLRAQRDWEARHPAPVAPEGKGAPLERDSAPVNPVQRSLEEARQAFGGRLFLPGAIPSDLRFGLLAANRQEWVAYARAVLQRLEATLPAESAIGIEHLLAAYPAASGAELAAASPRLNLVILSGAGLCGVLAAWCLFQRRREPLIFVFAGCGLLFALPQWQSTGFKEDLLMTGAPPALPARSVIPDFSSPGTAAQTVFDAAWAGDKAIVREGMSRECQERADTSGTWDRIMTELGKKTWVLWDSDSTARGATCQVFLLRHGRGDQVTMVREADRWRMEALPPVFVPRP
ncbi:MAG: serine/threonine protein kinase, partial [Akkermansiaceae bacterium]|nr:serine/threonine protein kinase [Akkermansiaceae bacterium]